MAEHQDLCANDELLRQLLLGKLAREQRTCLEDHVLGCHHCGERLAGISAEDTLVEAVRAQATLPDWRDDAEAQGLIDRLCRLPVPTMGFASGQAPADEELNELQRFLAPAQSSGELGRIGKYRVLKILGAGGMGIVMEAEDTQLGRRVALKAMKPLLTARPASKTRFLREARAAATIQHDHVVTIHEVNEYAGLPYLAMQLLSGESLQQRLARCGKLSTSETTRIAMQIALGLSAAHQQGVVHRDIKPDNIWLEAPHDRVRILDFGLAQVANDDVSLTQSGAIAGTPSYMSPEQARGEAVDHRSDLFSLGCVIYRMCTGRTPFSGSNTAAILLAVTQEEPPPLQRSAPDVPHGLSDLVAKLLRKDPRRRVPSVAEVVAALEAIARSAAIPGQTSRSRRWRTGRFIALSVALTSLLLLAAVVLRLATDRGTLVLELEHPDAAVTIDGRQVSLQIEGESMQIVLPSGKHELLVVKDGFKTYTDNFTMQRGERVVLKVRLEPPPRPDAVASSETPQRTVVPPSKASIAPLSSSEAVKDWVRSNAKPDLTSFLLRDLVPLMQQQQQANHGFFFYLGPGMTKSEQLAILAGYNGHFFACQFPPPKNYPAMTATAVAGPENTKRTGTDAKLIELTIKDADDLDPNREIHGSLKLQALCDKKAKYGVRLTCWSMVLTQRIEWTPDRSRGVEQIEFRQLPIAALGEHRPILVFAELCLFPERDDQPPVVVSDPLPALVNIR